MAKGKSPEKEAVVSHEQPTFTAAVVDQSVSATTPISVHYSPPLTLLRSP